MLTVDQHAAIRYAYYTEHKSIRTIARELNLSRQSVRTAIESPTAPRYTSTRPRSAPKLAPFRERLAALLAEQTRQPRKQRYTTHKIYQILATEGDTGSESYLRAIVAQVKQTRRRPKTFLPLPFQPGQDAQVDWGEAEAIIAGEPVTAQLFVMRLCYAQRAFAMTFPTQRQEAFFAGHVAAFAFFGGVPHRISYDNLTTAVAPIFTGRTRTERQAFTAFHSYYLFAPHFCNLNAGHEQGQVEHGIGYVRRNALVPVPAVDSSADLNATLLHWCQQEDQRQVTGQPRPIGVMWAEEQPLLRPLPPQPFPCCITTTATLTPYSQVIFETNRYSVPTDRAVRKLLVRAAPFHVDILVDAVVLATHPRCYDREQAVLDPVHDLPLLLEHPGALDHAKPIQRWQARWPPSYDRLLRRLRQEWPDGRGVRECVRVLQLHQQHPAPLIADAVAQALRLGCIQADGVRLCLQQLLHPTPATTPLDL